MLSRQAALDRYYLDVRCALVEVAATLDRIDRGEAEGEAGDPRLDHLRQAVAMLGDPDAVCDGNGVPNRSERMLLHFSDLDGLTVDAVANV